MDRINGANWIDIGGGKRGFRDRNTVAGLPGTEVTAAFMNGVQEEILSVIEQFGITPDPEDRDQLAECFRILVLNHGAVTLDTPGSGSFVVPDLVFLLFVEVWGAAGGGCISSDGSHAEGGGGGGYAAGYVSVTPGQSISYVIGSGGLEGTITIPPSNGGDGGTSSFGTFLAATGGGGGQSIGGAPGGGGVGYGDNADILMQGQSGTNGSEAVWAAYGGNAGGAGGHGDLTFFASGSWPGGGGSAAFLGDEDYATTAGADGGIIVRY